MTLVFWQNMLSIHQSAFIRSLAKSNQVTLVVEEHMEERRKSDKWDIPNFGGAEIYIKPCQDVVDQLLSQESAIHLFSGVASYSYVHAVFKRAVEKRLQIGLISEPYDWKGLKGKLRWLKYFLFRLKYQSSISFILAIGNKGRECFEKARFETTKIFDWGYFTEDRGAKSFLNSSNNKNALDLIFVGRLNKAKGIEKLIKACKVLEDKFNTLTIIGDGAEREYIINLIGDSPKYRYLGSLSNDLTVGKIAQADLTILPSIGKDGWGAVVNESLSVGVPVISSNYCGASVLLDGKLRGAVFSVEEDNLLDVLTKWMQKGKLPEDVRDSIKEWSRNTISGAVASEYFLEITNYIYSGGKIIRPVAPWLTK